MGEGMWGVNGQSCKRRWIPYSITMLKATVLYAWRRGSFRVQQLGLLPVIVIEFGTVMPHFWNSKLYHMTRKHPENANPSQHWK